MELLNGIFDKLSVASNDADSGFKEELNATDFTIFTPLSDLGYFTWKPEVDTNNAGYKELKNLESPDEILQHIDINGKPEKLQAVTSLKVPKRFGFGTDRTFINKYPFGQNEISAIYVAVKNRGLKLDDIDFVFGGSTLEMLATKDATNPYITTFIPGSKCILVVKRKEYTCNLSDAGFQFERFVTGKATKNTNDDIEFVEHMHLVKVGNYKVLFCAETDAIFQGSPAEIKFSNPAYWGTKVMFQMISNGSPKLCHGEKSRGTLTRVVMKRLSTISRDALEYSNISTLQKNILDGMAAIQSQLRKNDLRKISFPYDCSSLKLIPTNDASSTVLPPSGLVESILS